MKKIISIVLLIAVSAIAMAKPAKRGPIVRTAEDGTEQVVYLHGDEWFHYTTDENGQWLDETSLKPMTAAQKRARLDASIAAKAARTARAPQVTEGIGDAPNLAPRGLVILVNFKDLAVTTHKDTIDTMLNAANFVRNYSYTMWSNGKKYNQTIHSEGSARQYFHDQSYGTYNPIFDVVGPVTVSKEMAYYGENDSRGNDKRPEEMIQEACILADSLLGVDFTIYDNDNDGKVDFVFVIYAGFGEADGGSANSIWQHQWNLWKDGRISCFVDDLRIDRYACSSELSYGTKQYDGIATFCHEFTHVLGFPDLYATVNGTSHRTLANWDIMDLGCYNNEGNTPPAYSSYERFYMGWITPKVLADPTKLTIGKLNQDTVALLMCDGNEHNLIGYNPNPSFFYMLENRDNTGWDQYLPGKGLLITKIAYSANKWRNNIVNNIPAAMGVDMIEAKENTNVQRGSRTDAFPAGCTYFLGFPGHEIQWIELGQDGNVTCYHRWAETPIENVQNDGTQCTKLLRVGQVVIKRGGVEYDTMGRKL
ncbi:MAG: M6 family metalloprotease domain-containing protein [Paludibacteraceae bacterium]|nr:M6 family metalloprotease domain-containing protein [Paludibacteraceae bacterium]